MSTQPKHIAILLFPGFQFLDAAGPLDALNMLSQTHPLHLSLLAESLDPVTTRTPAHAAPGSDFAQSLVPTHTFASPPQGIEVLIVPGGLGTRDDANVAPVVEFLKRAVGEVRYVLTVCTGSLVLAAAGGLDGRRATTNKKAFNEVKARFPGVEWVAKARWVVDGRIWTSSGVSAGIDLVFAWIGEVYGKEVADLIADRSEYERNGDSENDRYAERWGAV